jgi:glyoxylase I family protein
MTEVLGFDHLYIAVSDLRRSETFYDVVMIEVLDFRKNTFMLSGEPHVHYFNRHFGYVLRPARSLSVLDGYAPGLHHLCLRVATIADVELVADELQRRKIDASTARAYPQYAPDYWATFFQDPDGLRLEITNYREERRQRHDDWESSAVSR